MTPQVENQAELDDPDRKIGTQELAGLLNISLRTLYNRMATGNKVPKPSSVGPRNKLEWRLSDVLAWMEIAFERQVYVGIVRRGYDWCPIVTRSGKTWQGQARSDIQDAIGAAVRYYESTETHGAIVSGVAAGSPGKKPNKGRR